MLPSYIVLTVLAVIIIALLITIFRLQKGGFNQLAAKMADKDRTKLAVLKPCPVCRTMLKKGEMVHSVHYRQKQANHKLQVEEIFTNIFGCPYCWPANENYVRICPVCTQKISQDGYLVARTFRKPNKKDHVHVIGCTECKKVR